MAKSNRESDYVIQAAKKRGADPMGFETTKDERFAISPEKIAHDVIGDSFFTMTKAQRNYIVELVRSGDLTSSEIAEEAKYATPYDPREGLSEQQLTMVDPRGLRFSEDQRSMPVKEMSQKEFYKTFFGYDYEEKEIPQKIREIYAGLMGMGLDAAPKTSNNLPAGRAYHPDDPQLNKPKQKMALAQGGNVRFFNPEPISYEQYSKGPVDFYNQALDTSSGISVSNPIRDDDDDDEDEENNRPDIYNDDGDGGNNDTENAMEYTISSDGSGYKASADVTSYSLDDINFGNTDVSRNTYSFTSPGKMAMDPATGDMNHSFSSMLDDYQAGIGAATEAIAGQKTSGGKFDTSSFAGFRDSVGRNIDAALSPTTVDRPFGNKPSAIEPGIAGAFSPAAPLMGMFGGMNMAQQARNAAAFQATGGTGGALMDVNGSMVSRMPGQSTFMGFGSTNAMGGMKFVYDGNLGGRTHDQMAAFEARTLGFVPGTLTEVYDPVKGEYVKGGVISKYIDSNEMGKVGGTYNPATGTFTDLNGNVSSMGTKKSAQSFVSGLNKTFGSNLSWSSVARGRTAARAAGIPFQDYMENQARKDATKIADTKAAKIAEQNRIADAKLAAEARAAQAAADQALRDQYGSGVVTSEDRGGDYGVGGGGGDFDSGPDRSQDRGDTESEEEGDFAFNEGGRVGMQQGGPAGFAERPEFVGGNQQPTDQQSIADDQPREVQEGTFVINSAAADEMGRDDVEKMIREAYQKAGESGMGAGQQGISQEVAIAVSRGEVTIPPHIAKIIGYDRLKKINNRGKKEVSRRQQEREQAAGGGFISRKKLAKGDRVTVYRGEPLDPAKVTPTDYGYGKENVGKYHTTDVKKAGRFAAGSGKGNQVIKSRKVTIDEMFNGVKDGFKMEAKKDTEYFAKMPKSELNKNLRFVDSLKKAYLAGERSLDDIAFFLQDQVFHDDKSRINFIETFKNDPKSAGKLAGRAIVKVATVATPPLAVLASAAEMLTPSSLGKGTRYDDSFMSYQYTPNK